MKDETAKLDDTEDGMKKSDIKNIGFSVKSDGSVSLRSLKRAVLIRRNGTSRQGKIRRLRRRKRKKRLRLRNLRSSRKTGLNGVLSVGILPVN